MTELQPFKEEKTGFLALKIKLGKRPLDMLVPIPIRTYGLNFMYIAQKMQKTIQKRLKEQKNNIPFYYANGPLRTFFYFIRFSIYLAKF